MHLYLTWLSEHSSNLQKCFLSIWQTRIERKNMCDEKGGDVTNFIISDTDRGILLLCHINVS